MTAAPRVRRGWLLVAGLTGELIFTLGVLVALFVVYSLWWTDVVAEGRAGEAGRQLRGSWSASPSPPAAPVPPTGAGSPAPSPTREYRTGDDVGFLHVPAMGRDYQVLIRLGTDEATLAEGVAGVYTEPYRSAMPWEMAGNFALAAHRDGHGAKFHDLDAVGAGDAIVVETRDTWYVYRVDGVLPETSKFDTGVIAPVPVGSPYRGPGRYITLTTCTPVYTSRYRMAVWGSLVRAEPVDANRTPPVELR